MNLTKPLLLESLNPYRALRERRHRSLARQSHRRNRRGGLKGALDE